MKVLTDYFIIMSLELHIYKVQTHFPSISCVYENTHQVFHTKFNTFISTIITSDLTHFYTFIVRIILFIINYNPPLVVLYNEDYNFSYNMYVCIKVFLYSIFSI